MSNLKRVLMLYGLIVCAVNIIVISSAAHATIVYVDKPDVLKISPKPNIQCGEPGEEGNTRLGGLAAASSAFDSGVDQGTIAENGEKQPAQRYISTFRSYFSFLLRYLIWRM
ncbi:MAG: hypothetical protein NTW97_03825 [Candidatus Krumholzibacteria bacterium]|nr:hypothetical protein [Candidatus Krumholzibacteria bacterium]